MDRAAGKTLRTVSYRQDLWRRVKKYWPLLVLVTIPLILVAVFHYAAFPGLRIVFMDYKPALGFERSKWVGWQTFQKVFQNRDFYRALRNSLVFNILSLLVSFPAPIILALMLNELKYPRFKKVSQTILYLPHFLSWVIIGSLAYSLFRPSTGLVNVMLMNAGIIEKGIPFLTEKTHWAVTYLLIGVWQGMGWGTIIYLAAFAGINGELYEAAMIDGAGRWKQMIHITLPSVKGTIITLLIMNLGRLMGSNFEALKIMGNTQVREYQYQLAIFVYEKGLGNSQYSLSTAVNLFQSLVGVILVLLSDRFAKLLGEDGLL